MSTAASLSPTITNMIRMDHSHVLMLFRRFKPKTSIARKSAIVTNACLALEIHAQLEEEIFYPALQRLATGASEVDKSVPEHDEVRRIIAELRQMQPGQAEFDTTFRKLIRVVLHHVADEETVLLPLAEERLGNELRELGGQMTKRRLELLRPQAGLAVRTAMASFPLASAMVALGAVIFGFALLGNSRER